MRIRRIVDLVLSACLLFAGRSTGFAAEYTVGALGEFHSISEALRRISPGDTIRVSAGVYEGNLLLDKTVTLLGEGKPVIRGAGQSSTVTIRAPGCTLKGFVVEHSGGMLVDEDSGILLRSDNNRILENELRDVLFGIYFFHSNHNTIQENRIRGRAELELGERGSGLHFWNSLGNTIENNSITDMRDGMYLQNADWTEVRRNRIFNVRYGLHYMYSNDNVFEDNVFENNVAGAAIMYSSRIRFQRNSFVHNRGFSSFGILFQDSRECVAEYNLFVDNAVGIFMEALADSLFRQNLIAANDTAIQAFSSAHDNEFTENNFVANLAPIQLIGKSTTMRWSRNGVGNYWSEYDGYDLDGNGIGDVPFRIQNLYEHLEGNYPRLRIYFFSPAAQALVTAERVFPVVPGSRERDEFPLMTPVKLPISLPDERRKPENESGHSTVALALSTLVLLALVIRKGVAR